MKNFYTLLITVMAMFVSLTACANDFVPDGYQNIQTEQPAINGCTTCHKADKAEALALSGDNWRLDKQAGSTLTIADLSTNMITSNPMDIAYREGRPGHMHGAACFAVKLKPDINTA